MKKLIPLFLVALFMVLSISDAEAQKKRKRRSDTREQKAEDPFDKSGQLYYEIKFGNLGIGSSLQLALKPTIGYNFTKIFSINASPKIRYTYLNQIGNNDLSFFDYGLVPGLRAKITETIFLQGEYGYHSIDPGVDGLDRFNKWAPLIGGGYYSGHSDWKWGIEILLKLDNEVRDAEGGEIIEYWFGVNYNF